LPFDECRNLNCAVAATNLIPLYIACWNDCMEGRAIK